MGLYYTPNPPHIGGAQPLEGKKLTPPAGPPPQNPPFNGGGSRVHQAILGCWAAAVVAAAVLPTLPRNLNPPISGPAVQAGGIGVVFDSKSAAVATGLGLLTFTDSTNLTVANNPNRALILTINLSGSPSGFTASWDGVAMTQLALIAQSTFDDTTVVFGLRNPNVGTKTLTASWTNSADFVASAVSVFNVDQTSDAAAFKNITTAQGTTSPASVTVNSLANGDMVVATHTLGAFTTTFSAVNNTQLHNAKVNSMAGAGNRATGSSPSVTMTATESVDAPWTSVGIDIQPVRTLPARWPQEATIAAWIPPAPAPIVGPKRTPPSGPVTFPFRGSVVPTEIFVAWTPPAFFPIVEVMLDPPLFGPIPQNPPFMGGAQIAQAILNAWIPPPPAPIVEVMLDPPIAGPAPTNPPFVGGAAVSQAILNAWIPPPPAPIVEVMLDPPIAGPAPQNPPFMGGAQVPQAVLIAWIPPPPMPIVAVNLDPPISGPLASNPPFMGGAAVPLPVQIAWLPAAPAPILAYNLTPPSAPVVTFTPAARFPAEVLNSWQLPPFVSIIAQNLTPPSGPVAFTPPARFQAEILNAWQVLAPAAIVAQNLTPPSGPVTTFPPLGSFVPREVLINWLPLPPAPIVARNLMPPISGPTPDNPPFIGALVPVAMPDDWVPTVARNLTPPSAPVIVFTPPARLPNEILSAWQIATPVAIVAQNLTPPSGPTSYVPVGARISVEILNAWISLTPMPVLAINLNPPISAPSSLPVGGGARVPGEVLINWLPPAPMPVLARNLTPPSGPVASNPPFTGGASLKLEIQLCWQAAQPGYPPLKAINKTPPTGPGSVTTVIHAKPFFVSFGLRPL